MTCRRLGQSGMTTFLVIVIMLAVVPLLIMILRNTSSQLLRGRMDKHIKGSRVLAADFISDVMRQFSEDYSVNHYDPFTLRRTNWDHLRSGRGGVTLTADAPGRFVVFHSTAEVGVGNELAATALYARMVGIRRKTFGVVKFVSDHARYAAVVPAESLDAGGDLTIGTPQTVQGGLWVGGNLRVNANDVWFRRHGNNTCYPVVVQGDLVLNQTDTRFDCPVFYTGNMIGTGHFSVTPVHVGPSPTALPKMTIPALKYAYFEDKYAFIRNGGGPYRWELAPTANNDATIIKDADSGNVLTTLPSTAVVIVQNADLTIAKDSRVGGKVTIVAVQDATAADGGNVNIEADIQYAGAHPRRADSGHSFAVIAVNRIAFRNVKDDDMNVVGLYMTAPIMNQNPPLASTNLGLFWMADDDDDDGEFRLDGAIMSPIAVDNTSDPDMDNADPFEEGRSIVYDPGLMNFLPPGIPERPVLVSVQYSN